MELACAGVWGRRTEYMLRYTDRLVASVSEGQILLCNGGGCSSVAQGEAYYVAARDAEAIPVSQHAQADPPPGDLPLPFSAVP